VIKETLIMPIDTIESLHEHLQWAIEVEHTQIPAYLCALYSIKEGHNRESAEVIESVFMEEMLHITLVANILNAVGGSPQFDKPGMIAEYPTYLPHSAKSFQVPLAKFSRESIEIFMKIERPESQDALPEDDKFSSLGQFYEALGVGLVWLSHQLGEENLFTGDPAKQITDELYYGGSGGIIAVYDLDSALAALEEVKEQGEGMAHSEVWDGDRNMFHPEREEVAHYFRFNEIYQGRFYQKGDTPQSGPTGESFAVDWDAVYNFRPNPRSQDYPEGSEIRKKMEDFNRTYSGILHLLQQCFNGKPRMLAVATGAMYELKQEAIELMQMPSGDGLTTTGPSFEYVAPEDRHLLAHIVRKIVVWPNGPYVVYGDIPLVRKAQVVSKYGEPLTWRKGEVIDTEETYALCRCGQSSAKPFCDGTHVRIGFDGSETADTDLTADRQVIFKGSGIVVKRDYSLCMEAGYCGNRFTDVEEMVPGTDDTQIRAQVIAMIERCPSGSFTYTIEPGDQDVEPDFSQTIAVTSEGPLAGPLWVTGDIPIERADGQPLETRNRVTLCRCGNSKNKPLCDGTHRELGVTE
jgi:CDGSH-type Zn-finger protein/rubrerythrin